MKKEFVFRLVLAAVIFFLVYQFGFKPIFDNAKKEPQKHNWSALLSDGGTADYDVVVFGAEPQGISAAISAARLGAQTLLISEGADVGGTVTGCLLPELELPLDSDKRMLNGGILEEMYNKLGSGFSDTKYLETMNKILKAEKNLSILYNTTVSGVMVKGSNIESVQLYSDGAETAVAGRMYIDASDSGALLDACKVPYFTGSGDLNLPHRFMPTGLNFEMSTENDSKENITEIKKLINSRDKLYQGLKDYEPLYINTRLDGLSLFLTEERRIQFKGLQISNVNVLDEAELSEAYGKAADEAENLALYISRKFTQFSDWTFSRAALKLHIPEARHYIGKYTLTVSDILDNRFPDDTIAMGSYPVLAGKFTESGTYVIGKGIRYGIPLRCLVPEKVTNLLMAGPFSSYSSLAASSAGTLGTGIAAGEAAGAAAVFCLVKNETPAFLAESHEKLVEFRAMLAEQNMYLPSTRVRDVKHDNWSYPAARQLLSLGLIAGGNTNSLNFSLPAKHKDLAFILLNGINRLDQSSYSLELDARIRPFITDDILTFDRAVKLLGVLYDMEGDTDALYDKLCAQSRINDVMQLRMKERKPLAMEDVYYLGAYSIRSYTGKDIPS